ncbi:MAG: hypothetical protein IJD22_01535 [Clostridia bacterium]|nr:hypothetical protein [Clostridia bacterium]
MKVNEAVAAASRLIGEGIERRELIGWLSEIETTVVTEIADTHMGAVGNPSPIDPESDGERQLFAPDPY